MDELAEAKRIIILLVDRMEDLDRQFKRESMLIRPFTDEEVNVVWPDIRKFATGESKA